MCVHGYVYVGDETGGVCGLNSVVYQSVGLVYSVLFLCLFVLSNYRMYMELTSLCLRSGRCVSSSGKF